MSRDDPLSRIESLERDCRRMRATGVVAVLVALGIACMGQARTAEKIVRVETLVLQDPEGTTRGWMGVQSNGVAQLWLSDGKGRAFVRLGVSAEGVSSVSVNGGERFPNATLTGDASEFTGLSVYDKDGLLRSWHGVTAGGEPLLLLMDKDSKEAFRAPAR